MKPPFPRIILFVSVVLATGLGLFGYVRWSRQAMKQQPVLQPQADAGSTNDCSVLRDRPYLAFRNTGLGSNHGCMAYVALDAPSGPRALTAISSDRVYLTASIGVTLQAFRGVLTTYKAVVFDRNGMTARHYKLAGVPSRLRLARDGTRAGMTVFVRGDSYNSGGFSTRTTLVDLESDKPLGDLEEFTVWREGKRFKKVDFNFWGVTFGTSAEEFYATLGTGGVFYLVRGNVSRRELHVMRDGVECPSLSPDASRLAFKSRVIKGGRLVWNIRVLDLKSGAEIRVNEERSVDDQVEWLDDGRLLYALPRNVLGSGSSDIWMAHVDRSAPPELFVSDGSSPCVVR